MVGMAFCWLVCRFVGRLDVSPICVTVDGSGGIGGCWNRRLLGMVESLEVG